MMRSIVRPLRSPRTVAVAVALCAALTTATAAAQTLRYDGWTNGASATAYVPDAAGVTVASCFDFSSVGDQVSVDRVELLFDGSGAEARAYEVDVVFYTTESDALAPAAELRRESGVTLTPGPNLSTINVASLALTPVSPLCVGIATEEFGEGAPGVGVDVDGLSSASSQHVRRGGTWSTTDAPGDFVLRLRVSDIGGGGGGDAGVEDGGGGSDAGGVDGSGGADGAPGPDGGIASGQLRSIEPTSGRVDEDIELTFFGDDFEGTLTFRIGPAVVSEVFVASSSVASGVLPADSLEPGTYDVFVLDGAEVVGSLTQGFQVRPPGAGAIEVIDVLPDRIRLRSEAQLRVLGSGFSPGLEASAAGRPFTSTTFVSVNELSVSVTPDHFLGPGIYDVIVTADDGTEVVASGALTVFSGSSSDGGCAATASAWPSALGAFCVVGALWVGRRRRR